MMRLLGQVTLVTPNDDELETLVGDMQPGRWAIEHGLAILHTGGHGSGDTLHDVLWLPDGSHRTWSHPRVNTPHTHGSGCTLSTAVAVGLAKGLTSPKPWVRPSTTPLASSDARSTRTWSMRTLCTSSRTDSHASHGRERVEGGLCAREAVHPCAGMIGA